MTAALGAEGAAAGEGAAAAGESAGAAESGAAKTGKAGKPGKAPRSVLGFPVPGFVPDTSDLKNVHPAGIGGNRVLVAEFIACMIVVGLGPLLNQTDSAAAWLKKGAAVTGVFAVLSLIASGGARASRICAAFGGLITLGLLINDRALFTRIVDLLGAAGGVDTTDTEDVPDINEVLGDTGN